jgi:hypothetical protein
MSLVVGYQVFDLTVNTLNERQSQWTKRPQPRYASIMKRALIIMGSATFLAGCAINSGVVPAGQGTYFITRQAATGFTGIGDLKADAYRQADAFCRKRGLFLDILHTREAPPPYIFGNFPKVEVRFTCLRTNHAPVSQSAPATAPVINNTVIEERGR